MFKFKLQYFRKSEAQFNVWLKYHRKNVTSEASIPVSVYFIIEGHYFQVHVKFVLIEQLYQTNPKKSAIFLHLNTRGTTSKMSKHRIKQNIVPQRLPTTYDLCERKIPNNHHISQNDGMMLHLSHIWIWFQQIVNQPPEEASRQN